jgi:hypothetical protein
MRFTFTYPEGVRQGLERTGTRFRMSAIDAWGNELTAETSV